MAIKRSLWFVGLGSITSLLILYLSISSLSRRQTTMGCPVSTSGFVSLQEGQVDPSQTVAFWQNSPVTPPPYIAQSISTDEQNVLGAVSDDKWIEIDLGRQMLIAHQGDQIILQSPISSGLWNKTPTGEYRIWYKIRSTKMEGGSKLNGTYYYLPNVPYAMYFYKDYGIHGTYWHNNFGRPMSHGCVNSPPPIAEKLFYWANPPLPEGKHAIRSTSENPGTRVIVHN